MKVFDMIMLIILSAPLGLFVMYAFFLGVTYKLRIKPVDAKIRCLMTIYSVLTACSGVLIACYYYLPDVFRQFNIVYFGIVAFSMAIFYNFQFFTLRSNNKFSSLNYIVPGIICIGLWSAKLFFPNLWREESNNIALVITLIFAIVYTLLPLYGMYRFQQDSAESGKVSTIDKSEALSFVMVLLMFPLFMVVFPLAFGHNPNIIASLCIMASILVAVFMNIPLTYGIIRHYTYAGVSRADAPLFAPSEVMYKRSETTASTISKRQPDISRPTGDLDKKRFEQFFRKHKPFLNPQFSIYDLVEQMGSNRTYISQFINRTYGMNFTGYVNGWRLREMERLKSLPTNKNKSVAKLALQSGFGSYASYHRAKIKSLIKKKSSDEYRRNH